MVISGHRSITRSTFSICRMRNAQFPSSSSVKPYLTTIILRPTPAYEIRSFLSCEGTMSFSLIVMGACLRIIPRLLSALFTMGESFMLVGIC